MSRKSERLINLVIALLATKRNLTKSEIFRAIDGYEGSLESMERMFERDKDELRSLGIDIEVSGLDPLFEDEVGYTIRPESFVMDTNEFSASQISFMSLAAQIWKDASLDEVSKKALRKLSHSNASVDVTEVPFIAPQIQNTPSFLVEIINGIADRRTLEFSYLDLDLKENQRRLNVYSYFSLNGFWYFYGYDLDRGATRTFRCDRIQGEVSVSKKSQTYEIPDRESNGVFDAEAGIAHVATLQIQKGRGTQLRNLAIKIQDCGDTDLVEITYFSDVEIISLILWHLEDVEVISPLDLRAKIVQALKNLVTLHG